MSTPSQRNPQSVPADHCYSILQDHGPGDGGWGPAAVAVPPLIPHPRPVVYTGSDPDTLTHLATIAQTLAQATGKPTRLVRFNQREDVLVIGGSS